MPPTPASASAGRCGIRRDRSESAVGLAIRVDKMTIIDVIAEPQRLHQLDLAVLAN
jgi:hypothetical protein